MDELDGLRGLAILLVVFFHYFVSPVKTEPGTLQHTIMRPLWLALTGVDLFFVLSGFLIGGILLDNRTAANYFKTFYIRRFCRIFPLYALWLALFVVLEQIVRAPQFEWLLHHNPLPLWSYATFTQNLVMATMADTGPHFMGVTWSLAVEEQFYLVLPLLIYFVSPRVLPLALIVLIIAAPLARLVCIVQYPVGSTPIVSMLTPCRGDSLFLGVLCACMMRREGGRRLAASKPLVYSVIMVVILFFAVMFYQGHGLSSPYFLVFGFSAIALGYAALLLRAVTDEHSSIGLAMRWAPLRRLGLIAYGVYLFHQAINGTLHALLWGHSPRMESWEDAVTSLVAIGLTIGLATLSWQHLESRFVALGHRVRYHIHQKDDIRPTASHE